MKNKGVRLTVIGLLAIGALFIGIYASQQMHIEKKMDVTQFHGTYLEHPRAVNNFDLTGMNKEVFNNSSLKGRWTFMFFGFTNCGYLCPTTMAELGKMYRILEKKNVSPLPQIVMISIDPKRDTLKKLKDYVTSFHSNFYAAHGDEDTIKAMTREMGVAYAIVQNKEQPNNEYDIQHSGAIMLFNPQGELNAFFTTPHHADILAKDYLLLVS